MERLRQSDLRSLLAFVRECYAIHDPKPFETFLKQLVTSLPRLIPATHVTYNEMNPEKSESQNCVNTVEFSTPQAARLWETHMNEHPVLEYVLRTGDHRAMRISDFWSEQKMLDSGLHSDFYKRYDIGDALCITVPCSPPRVIGVGWHDKRRFTERERQIADLVRPHMSQAWQNARFIARTRHRLEMLGLGMESLSAGVILCSTSGRVQFMDAQARRYLAEYAGAKRQTDRQLPDDLLRWARAQQLPQSRIDDAPPVRSPLVYEREGKRLVIRMLSQPDAHMILMEEQRTLPDASVFASLGITAREAEVLDWITRGKTNQEIAIILEMQPATVKKHVEHILEKLGVETRTAAAAAALASASRKGFD